MSPTGYLRILVALLGLLLFATSASAECAWVLWKQTQRGPIYEAWGLYEAYESKKACDDGKVSWTHTASIAMTEGDRRAGYTRAVERGVVLTRDKDGKEIRREEFYCLPSATDPRPRFKE